MIELMKEYVLLARRLVRLAEEIQPPTKPKVEAMNAPYLTAAGLCLHVGRWSRRELAAGSHQGRLAGHLCEAAAALEAIAKDRVDPKLPPDHDQMATALTRLDASLGAFSLIEAGDE